MATKKNPFAFTGGAAVGGAIAKTPVVPKDQPGNKHKGKGKGGGGHKHRGGFGGQGDGAASGDGSGSQFDTGIPGNITTPAGLDVANEHPDYYWDWLAVKAGLNQNRMTPFGDWYNHQFTDLYQPLFNASLLDNPNNKFPNFLGGYGVGSPTIANPGQTNPFAPNAPGPGDSTDEPAKRHRRNRKNNNGNNGNNNRDRHNRNNKKGR